jgi:hypothetical protein
MFIRDEDLLIGIPTIQKRRHISPQFYAIASSAVLLFKNLEISPLLSLDEMHIEENVPIAIDHPPPSMKTGGRRDSMRRFEVNFDIRLNEFLGNLANEEFFLPVGKRWRLGLVFQVLLFY